MKVMITGAASFIGSALTLRLLERIDTIENPLAYIDSSIMALPKFQKLALVYASSPSDYGANSTVPCTYKPQIGH